MSERGRVYQVKALVSEVWLLAEYEPVLFAATAPGSH